MNISSSSTNHISHWWGGKDVLTITQNKDRSQIQVKVLYQSLMDRVKTFAARLFKKASCGKEEIPRGKDIFTKVYCGINEADLISADSAMKTAATKILQKRSVRTSHDQIKNNLNADLWVPLSFVDVSQPQNAPASSSSPSAATFETEPLSIASQRFVNLIKRLR